MKLTHEQANVLRADIDRLKYEMNTDLYNRLNELIDDRDPGPPPPEPRELRFLCKQTSEVVFYMNITEEDAQKLEGMSDKERSDWIMEQEADFTRGLYDWESGKEYVIRTDSPYQVEIK